MSPEHGAGRANGLVEVVGRSCQFDSPADIRTVTDLAIVSGLEIRTLERKCAAAGITAKSLLDFVRCARVVIDRHYEWSDKSLFPDLDPRTSGRLRRLGALSSGGRPTLTAFVRQQKFIQSPRLREQLLEQLSGRDAFLVGFMVDVLGHPL